MQNEAWTFDTYNYMKKDRIKSFSLLAVPFVMAGIGFALHQAVLTGTTVPRVLSMQMQVFTIVGAAILYAFFWSLCLALVPATYDKSKGWIDPHGVRFEWLHRAALCVVGLFWISCIGCSTFQLGLRFGLVSATVLLSLMVPGLFLLSGSMREAGGRPIHPEEAMGQGLAFLAFSGVAFVVAGVGLLNAR